MDNIHLGNWKQWQQATTAPPLPRRGWRQAKSCVCVCNWTGKCIALWGGVTVGEYFCGWFIMSRGLLPESFQHTGRWESWVELQLLYHQTSSILAQSFSLNCCCFFFLLRYWVSDRSSCNVCCVRLRTCWVCVREKAVRCYIASTNNLEHQHVKWDCGLFATPIHFVSQLLLHSGSRVGGAVANLCRFKVKTRLRPGQVGSLSQDRVGRRTTGPHTSEQFRVTICRPSPCLCIVGGNRKAWT